MRQRDEQDKPHVGDGSFGMENRLQGKCENDCRAPAELLSTHARAPGKDRQCREGSGDCRWESRRKIVLTKDFVAGSLCPIGEGRLIEAKLIVKVRNDVIAALEHLA
jgi:hypothetical protein